MWHGRHHSAQKSTITGCELLAVKTSASKFPSIADLIELSAMFFVLNGLAASGQPLFFSPCSTQLDVPAGFWFRAPCPGLFGACSGFRDCPDGFGASSVTRGVCPAWAPSCPELREACSKSCVGSPVPSAAVPELCASGDNPCAPCPACPELRAEPRRARAASYSFAYSAAGVFHEKSFAIPFNWMRFQIRSSM